MRTDCVRPVAAAGLPQVEGSSRRIRALVVDDMPSVVGLVSLILKRGNADVVATAKDGLAAVHAATKLKPDLIIMDVNMPSMNGFEATVRIRCELPSAKIILMSADGDEVMTEVAADCGADAFVHKNELARLWDSQLERMFSGMEMR